MAVSVHLDKTVPWQRKTKITPRFICRFTIPRLKYHQQEFRNCWEGRRWRIESWKQFSPHYHISGYTRWLSSVVNLTPKTKRIRLRILPQYTNVTHRQIDTHTQLVGYRRTVTTVG